MSDEPTKGAAADADGDVDMPDKATGGADGEEEQGAPEAKEELGVDEEDDGKFEDKPPKAEVRAAVELIVAKARSSGELAPAVDALLQLEKKARQQEEEADAIFVAKGVLSLCKDLGAWKLVAEHVQILARRRSQFRKVTKRCVQLAMQWLDEGVLPDKRHELEWIAALREVTEGKIYVEVQRARLTRKLAAMQEADGDVPAACKTLQELQIETFGSMRKREKCDFLLEQVRLCLAVQDFVRAGIIRNKITSPVIKGMPALEQKFLELSLIYFYHRDLQLLELAKAYRELQRLYEAEEDQRAALVCASMALALCEHGEEQSDLLHRVRDVDKKALEHVPRVARLLTLLTTMELVPWPLPSEVHEFVAGFAFRGVVDAEQQFAELLHDRVVQHNIRVVHCYYARISLARLSQFLGVDASRAEKYVSDMVTGKLVYARIDRLDGVVSFREASSETSTLDAWRGNIERLLDLVDKTCHEIHKERVVHGKKKGKGKGKGKGKKGRA